MWSDGAEAWLRRQTEQPAPWLAGLAALLLLEVVPWWTPTPDSVIYLSVARSLARTGVPAALGSPHTGLPIGYPALLSPLFAFGDRPFLAIAALQWALAVAAILLVFAWARRLLPELALHAALLVGANVSIWILVRRPLSEMAFLVVLLAAASLLDRVLVEPRPAARVRLALLGAGLVVTSVLLREAGVVLIAGFAVAAWRAARRGEPAGRGALTSAAVVAILGGAFLTALLAHDLTTARNDSGRFLGTHLDGFLELRSDTGTKLLEGLRLRVAEIGRLAIPGLFKAYGPAGRWLDPSLLVEALAAVMTGLGWWQLAARSSSVLVLAFPFYFALHCAWSFDAGTRYLAPMLPVIVLSLLGGIEHRRDRLRIASLALGAHLLVTLGYHATRELPRAHACDRAWSAVDRAVVLVDLSAGPVASRELPECEWSMASYALDRPVLRDPATLAGVGSVIGLAGREAPAGFRPTGALGELQVWRREDAQSSSASSSGKTAPSE